MTANSWPCINAFTFPGAGQTTCSWLNSTFVKASFAAYNGSQTLLGLGVSVTLQASKIKAQCSSNCQQNTYSVSSFVTTTISSNPVTPGPVLLVPPTISSCTNLTVDGTLSTGSGGRGWTSVDWKLTAFTGSSVTGNVVPIYPYDVLDILQSYGLSVNRLINVPVTLLQEATYTITLTLTNFLGQSNFVSASFQVSGNRNLPTLSIVGSSLLSINPSQAVTVYSSAQVSSCSESQTIQYSWNVFVLGGQDSGVTSSSNDPKTLIIGANKLKAGTVYQAQVTALVKVGETDNTATSLITIQVVNGPVNAVVKGGYNRAVFITSTNPLTLDASVSTDSNLASNAVQGLSFQWSCLVISTASYGADCSSVFGSQSTKTSSVTFTSISPVIYGVTYAVTVKVKIVSVQNLVVPAVPTADGTSAPTYSGAITYISSAYTKFNADSQVSIFGYVQAGYALTAVWTAKVGDVDASFTSLTSKQNDFTTSEATSRISFPLAIPGGTFVPGSQVTFRIGANMQGATSTALYSYSEIVLIVNAPPSGGSLSSTPVSGEPLTTTFALLATGWVDDPSDYPLTYDFVYTLSTAVSTIKARSTSSSASSSFPAGLASNDYLVTAYGRAYDSLLASANASFALVVKTAPGAAAPNVTNYLLVGIAAATASGDSSAAIAVVNNAANTINTLNCTGAPAAFCSSLNRRPCATVAHTCGSCLTNFTGIADAANAKCHNSSAVIGKVGDPCTSNDGCLLGLCSTQFCAEPPLLCPSSDSSQVCSGHGTCSYSDSSGNSMENCTIANTQCTASCQCNSDEFGGVDCSLSSSEVASRDAARTAMCTAIVSYAATSNPTSAVVETLVNSLLVTYNPDEVVTAEGIAVCQDALTLVAEFAAAGLLGSSTGSTASLLVSTASNFVQKPSSSRRRLTSTNSTAISSAVGDITDGVLQSMVSGQSAISIVSTNIRIQALRNSVSSLANSSFSPPATDSEVAYGALRPSLSFADVGPELCDAGGGYVQMSVMAWGTNPYPGSSDQGSPLMRLEAASAATASARRRLNSYTATSRTQTLTNDPVYFITLQFSSKQDFNFSQDPSNIMPGSNVTFPECNMYNGVAYETCKGCNISSYTNYNVTYGCENIEELCGASADASRRLSQFDESMNYFQSVADGSLYDRGRRLQTISGDDDGTVSQTGSFAVSQFGAIFSNAGKEVSGILTSFNPFAIDPVKSMPVLILVGCLVFVIFVGMLYFARWDRNDHHVLIYAHADHQAANHEKTRLMIERYNQASSKESKRKTMKKMKALKRRQSSSVAHIDRDKLQNLTALSTITSDKEANEKISPKSNISTANLAYAHQVDKEKYTADEVGAFLNQVMPIENNVLKVDPKFQFTTALFNKHDYSSMFFEGSIEDNRLIRWANVCASVMIALMLDTIFFSIFYADTGTCEAFTDESACTAQWNKASNAPMCRWTADVTAENGGSCALISPPNNLTFTMVLLLITIIIGVPIQLLCDLIRHEICSKRPDFEAIGWDSGFWLATESQGVKRGDLSKESVLKELFKEIDRHRELEVKFRRHNRYKTEAEFEARNLDETNFVARTVYHNTNSVQEEVDQIYAEVKVFVEHHVYNCQIPWKTSNADAAAQHATAKAIAVELNINDSGQMIPLTARQWRAYGTQRNRLETKIAEARRKVALINDVLEKMGDVDAADKDIALIQFFVLEQFSTFKRYALRYQFFGFNATTPEKIHPILWMLGWLYIIGFLLFSVYWVLAWGIQSGPRPFRSWGINFTLQFLEDIFVIQVAKVYVLFILAMMSIRPQLNFIYRTLNKLAINYAQEGPVDKMHDIRVVQHMSPACRAARLTVSSDLASAKILRQVDDIDLAVCRMNESKRLYLFALFLLGIPAALSVVSLLFGDLVLESTVPSVFSGFILGNYYLTTVSVPGLIIIYCVITAFYLWKRTVNQTALERVRKVKKDVSYEEVPMGYHERHDVRRAKRTRHKHVYATFVMYCGQKIARGFAHMLLLLYYPLKAKEMNTREHYKLRTTWGMMNLSPNVAPEVEKNYRKTKQVINRQQSIYSSAIFWNNKDPQSSILRAILDSGEAVHKDKSIIIPLTIQDMASKPIDWVAISKKAPKPDYLQELLAKKMYVTNHDKDVFDAIQLSVKDEDNAAPYRQPLLKPILYRDHHEIVSKPQEALLKMLRKHVGQTHMTNTTHSHAEEYYSTISQYVQYTENIHLMCLYPVDTN